jgi:hypothetical protein
VSVIPVVPGLADLIPDWAGENSRSGVLREFSGKSLIFLIVFRSQTAVLWGKPKKIPAQREKPGIAVLPAASGKRVWVVFDKGTAKGAKI